MIDQNFNMKLISTLFYKIYKTKPFVFSWYRFSVLENATVDTDIGQVLATDADIEMNAKLIFTDASSEYFDVNTTGFLKVNRLLDRETKDRDVFIVRFCDSGRDISLCTESWITVNIQDVNEAPSFKYNKEVPFFRIPENSNCSSISDLTRFFVDGDLGVNRELNFSVLRLALIIKDNLRLVMKNSTTIQINFFEIF